MVSDNTSLGPNAGGDILRDLARLGKNVKTQAMQLDLGGSSENAEVLITAGQQLMAVSVPVVFASDHTIINTADSANPYRGTSTYFSGISGTVTIASGARIVSLSATSPNGGTIKIFGGSDIIILSNMSFTDNYSGFVGPGNIIFSNTDSYYLVVNK